MRMATYVMKFFCFFFLVPLVGSVNITWIYGPSEQNPLLGKNYKIICIVGGDPAPMINWLRRGTRLTSKSDKRYVFDHDGLFIKNVQESDDGIYTCRALEPATGKVDEKVIKVEVFIAPQIQPIPPVQLVEGDQARVECKATSKPPSHYIWIKEVITEDLHINTRVTVDAITGDLTISKVEREDDATYRCVATNPAGRAEQLVNITVFAKPKIYELLNVTAPIYNETTLICKASGRPAPSVYFRKVGRVDNFTLGIQPDDPRIRFENRVSGRKDETFGILTIYRVNRLDDGLYECIAENQRGMTYKNGYIAVLFPPTFETTKEYHPI